MTTEEQYFQNRATAEVIRFWFRKIAKILKLHHPDWKFSLEVGPSVVHGLITTDNRPPAQDGFDSLTRILREFDPTLNVRLEGNPAIVPVPGMTLPLYFPQPAPGPSYPPPPPIDYVPDPNKLPPTCPICGPKIYTA